VLVGDGDYRPRLEAQIRDLGLADAVSVVGAVPRAEIPSYYSLAHAAVFPSIGDEAFGISVVEAMACGVPAIATTSGGMPESVVEGETGFLVPPRDPVAIAKALARLAKDPTRARAMGMNARRRAAECFDWSRLTDDLLVRLERLRISRPTGRIE
jgi:glycosyltransferase involved in cell wall biosynthesis